MKDINSKLILASASPRRIDLLKQINIEPYKIIPADINEMPLKKEEPSQHAKRLSFEKAEAIYKNNSNCFVLAADTVVACGKRILPKAEDPDTARTCLKLLSGRRHRVLGGISLFAPDGKHSTHLVTTSVKFKHLDKTDIQEYLDSNEWNGKAGGYAIQGLAAKYIKFINGSYSNIVGLSLYDTEKMLKGMGYA